MWQLALIAAAVIVAAAFICLPVLRRPSTWSTVLQHVGAAIAAAAKVATRTIGHWLCAWAAWRERVDQRRLAAAAEAARIAAARGAGLRVRSCFDCGQALAWNGAQWECHDCGRSVPYARPDDDE